MEIDKKDNLYPTEDDQNGVEVAEEINLSTSNEENAVIEERRQKLKAEIDELESDIKTLKQALVRKETHLAELKKELGITMWSQIKDGFGQKYQSYQNTKMYTKLSAASSNTKQSINAAGEKTSAALKSFGNATAKKWNDIRESSAVHSIEEKMWATTGAIKAKLSGQKSGNELEQTSKPEEIKTEAPSAI